MTGCPLFQEIEFTKEEATCEGVSMIVLENKIKSVEKAHVVPMCSGVPMSPIKKRALNLSGLQPWKSLVTHVSDILEATDHAILVNREVYADLEPLFDFVSQTESGANLLARLKSEGSQIQIKLVSRDKMKSSSRGAYFDPETKTIFLERGSELGLLGPYFVHELTHALDTANIKAFAACEQVKTCTTIPDYKTERLAYDAQYKFIQEMKETMPCFGGYIDAQDKNGRIIAGYFSDVEIMQRKEDDYIDEATLRAYATAKNFRLSQPAILNFFPCVSHRANKDLDNDSLNQELPFQMSFPIKPKSSSTHR